MSRRPLSDLLAVRSSDPGRVDALERELRSSGRFDEVWRPAPGWVAAAARLPDSEPDGDAVRRAGLAFVEGRDVVGADDPDEAMEIARRAGEAPETLDRLPGDFTFLAFGADGSLTAVRAAAGLAPLYVTREGAVASRMELLLRFGLAEPELDPLPNAIWLTGFPLFPDGRSLVKGVRVVDRGSYVRIGREGGVRSGSYWNPRAQELAPPTEAALEERAARLREILVERLTADLAPDGGNLLSLSGGVDSSSLLALAAGTLGLPVAAVSLLPEAGPALDRELGYIRAASERGPLAEHFRYPLNDETRERLRRSAPPVATLCLHPILMALPDVLERWPARVLFGGESGDDIAGSHLTMEDWVLHTSFPRLLLGSVGRFPHGPQDVGRWLKWRLQRRRGRPRLPYPHRLASFAHPDVQAEYGAWLAERRRELLADDRPRPAFARQIGVDGWITMNWEVTVALGVRRSTPFYNRATVELAFGTHPRTLVGPGMKRLLKRALAADVPRAVLERPDKGQWASVLPEPPRGVEEPLDPSLAALVHPSRFRSLPESVDSTEASRLRVLARFLNAARAARAGDPAGSRPIGSP